MGKTTEGRARRSKGRIAVISNFYISFCPCFLIPSSIPRAVGHAHRRVQSHFKHKPQDQPEEEYGRIGKVEETGVNGEDDGEEGQEE